MQPTSSDDHRIADQRRSNYPALDTLRLTDEDLETLADQGFVCAERRGDRTYYKLRFRRGRRQVVRYLGGPVRAAAVQQELAVLQAEKHAMQELTARVKFANKLLRDAKRTLAPVLLAHGFVFHGLAIRRPRRPQGIDTNSSS